MRSQLRKTSPAVVRLCLPEHVRMAADQLLDRALGDLGEASRAALLEQQGQEVDLEQHVAELVDELGVVAAVRGVGQLVGLLDRVRDDRALVLLAVPGALAAQPAGDLVEAAERVERFAIHPATAVGVGAGAPPGGTGAPGGPMTRACAAAGQAMRRLDRARCGSAGIGCPGNTAACPGETAGVGITGGAPGIGWTVGVKFSQRSIR